MLNNIDDKTYHQRGGECVKCIHNDQGTCRRFPPVVTQMRHYAGSEWKDTQWGFPPSGRICGEYSNPNHDHTGL